MFMIRLTSFPILLAIAYYERQTKQIQATTFTEAVAATAERMVETLPRSIKRLSTRFEIKAFPFSDSHFKPFLRDCLRGKRRISMWSVLF